jgi:hypothetical protein
MAFNCGGVQRTQTSLLGVVIHGFRQWKRLMAMDSQAAFYGYGCDSQPSAHSQYDKPIFEMV